jgi:ribosomal-protein-alanine N-acetyltransferase
MKLAAPFIDELPTIETPRLILRKLQIEDAQDMFEYASDRELAYSGLWLPYDELQESVDDIKDALNGYADKTLLDWAVEHKADQKIIGRLGLQSYHPRHARADLSYAFNRNYWAQGIATEAVQAILPFGFETLRLNRIGAYVLWDNEASMRVLSKIGMQHEGIQRQVNALRGKPEDLHMFSILYQDRINSK